MSKILEFSKGISLCFWFKIFPSFFWRKLRQENVFADILKTKKAFLDYENKNLRKVKKLRFFQRGWSMVLIKNLKFLLVFILVKIG